MAKYLTKTDNTITFDTPEWLKDLGAPTNYVKPLIITINPDKTIKCSRGGVELRYSGARMRNSVLLYDMERVADNVKITGSFSEMAQKKMRAAMSRRWADRIWGRIFTWLKPRLHQEALHAYYLVPTKLRTGVAQYNMLARSETLREDLLRGNRFMAMSVIHSRRVSYEDAEKPWQIDDLEWEVNACPEMFLGESARRLLPIVGNIKMPANWAARPESVLQTIEYAHAHSLPLKPLENTRILQFVVRNYQMGNSDIVHAFLADWKDSWEVIKRYNKYDNMKLLLTSTRYSVLGRAAQSNMAKGRARRFSQHLAMGINEHINDNYSKLITECRPKAPIFKRVDGNVRMKLTPISPDQIIPTFQALRTKLIGPNCSERIAYKFEVNDKLYGVVLKPTRIRTHNIKLVTFGYDNEILSKHWQSRIKNILLSPIARVKSLSAESESDDDWIIGA